MRKIKVIANAYSEKLKEEFKTADTIAFIQGRYMVEALLCTVGNMFSKNANFKYPEQAYSMGMATELTEEEIENQREQFIAMLKVMEKNFNLSKDEEKAGSET